MIITFSRDFQPIQTPELDVLSEADAVGYRHYRGNVYARITWARGRSVRFTLETKDAYAYGSRRAQSGRHMRKASWEAHRDVLRALFKLDPDATVRTALATYRGAADFEYQYERTADHNVGSRMDPITIRECSVC